MSPTADVATPDREYAAPAVLVTGAGSGIGRAIAVAFGRSGARVAALDIDGSAAAATAEAVARCGGVGVPVIGDVGCADAMNSGVAQATAALGGLDVLINNAGIDAVGTVADTTEDDWDRLFRINVKGVFLCSRAAQPHLEASDRGAVVNIASIVGLVGVAGYAAYSATKGAVISLTRAMAIDLAPFGVRVNAICPGLVRTPMAEQMLRRRGEGDVALGAALTQERYPLRRLGTVEDIAAAALFLAGPQAQFMTGSLLTVDGGMTAQ